MVDSHDTIAFAQKIFAILEQGSKSATYKYAVLFALLELCCERYDEHGEPPQTVTTDQLARKVLQLYWPQSIPFPRTGEPLGQFHGGQAKVIRLIERARRAAPEEWSAHRFAVKQSDAYERLVRKIEWNLVEHPLPRLQVVPGLSEPFIYDIWWDTSVTRTEFRSGSNQIYFIGDAQHHLVRLQGLLRPLLEQEWTRWVSANNRIEDEVGRYLFPGSRAFAADLQGPLWDLQGGRCFYCDHRIRAGRGAVDHFLPWARTHNDDLGNLVLADSGCNARKGVYFAAAGHLDHWVARLEKRHGDLAAIAEDRSWIFDRDAALGLARGIYLYLPEGMRLWIEGSRFEPLKWQAVRQALRLPLPA